MASVSQGRSRRAAAEGWAKPLRGLLRVAFAILVVLPLVLALLYAVVPPVSTLMLGRWLTFQPASRDWVALADMSPNLPRAVIASEDSRFCMHHGIDWYALQEVIEDADEDGPSRGASTISMQTAKNVFLWPGRSYIRKGLEMPIAILIDALWGKRRVMEAYLNVAEWGDGVFGAEAAAQRHFRKSAKALTRREAALLAAVLPNPGRRDAGRPSAYVSRRANAISGRMGNEDVSCMGF